MAIRRCHGLFPARLQEPNVRSFASGRVNAELQTTHPAGCLRAKGFVRPNWIQPCKNPRCPKWLGRHGRVPAQPIQSNPIQFPLTRPLPKSKTSPPALRSAWPVRLLGSPVPLAPWLSRSTAEPFRPSPEQNVTRTWGMSSMGCRRSTGPPFRGSLSFHRSP